MEAFTLLKYWRGAGLVGLSPSSETTTTTTILSAVSQNDNATSESDDDDDNNDEDEGPFFDLEFTAPDEEEEHVYDETHPNKQQQDEEQESEDETETESEFKITLSPSSNERNDANLSLSPLEDIEIVELKPSSFVLNNASEPNSKPQFTASLLKSATKFRVFMSGLKKPKIDSVITQKKQKPNRIKFKIEEVPIVSLFTRDNSSKGNIINNNKSQTSQNQSQNQNQKVEHEALSPLEEKRFSKEVVMHKYLKMVKPLYIRVSRRYSHGEKVEKFASASTDNKVEGEIATEEETVAESEENNAKSTQTQNQSLKQGNIPAGLRVVYKHLGKSRSASSAVAASPPALVSSKRRDDSLLQQQDGIQGAILHCKRSFNASRECESSSQLPRSVSDPLQEISSELSSKSSDKRLSG